MSHPSPTPDPGTPERKADDAQLTKVDLSPEQANLVDATLSSRRGNDTTSPPGESEPHIPPDLVDHPRYLILGTLGRGGMGTVFRAQHRLMHRQVALKVLSPKLVERPNLVDHFRREVQAAASLSHPNIVTAYDADQAGNTHFLVMEFVPGIDLDRLIVHRGTLSPELAADYARQAARGLQHAYRRGMTHGDIKPHNLMLTPQGQIKILDFGLTRFLGERLLESMTQLVLGSEVENAVFPEDIEELIANAPTPVVRLLPAGGKVVVYSAAGTADYMAPEVIMDPGRADIRSDIYSLGCTLYRLLSGQVPFPTDTIKNKLRGHLRETPAPLRGPPVKLIEAVERMMAKDPSQRYQTPGEVVDALGPFASPRRGRILVVEDDVVTRMAMKAALEDHGFAVAEAAHGLEALERLRGGARPDLILLDLRMPIMDGVEFLQEQSKDPALASIPVIIVSACSPGQAQAFALSAAGYLQKPLDVEELNAMLQGREPPPPGPSSGGC